MVRERGANGRFVAREGARRETKAIAEDGVEEGSRKKPLRPRECQTYLRSRLAKEFRTIVDGFVSEARNGGCAHMKLAAELLEASKREAPRRKGTAQRLLEELGE